MGGVNAQNAESTPPKSTPSVPSGESQDASSQSSRQSESLALMVERVVVNAAKPMDEGKLRDAVKTLDEFTVEHAKFAVKSQEDAAVVERLAVVRFDIGSRAEKAGDFVLAAEQFAVAAQLREVSLPPGHPYHTIALAKLGGAKRMVGDFAGSKEALETALAQVQAAFPPQQFPKGHQLIALVLNDLGALQRSRGDYAAAAAYYLDALAMLRRLLPGDDPSIANAENNLAFALQWDGQFAESRRHFERAIEIYEQESNLAKPGLPANAALIRHSLGGLMQSEGEYGLAEQYYLDALDRLKKEYPETDFPHGHPRLATVCSSLGMLYFEVKVADKSIEFHQTRTAVSPRVRWRRGRQSGCRHVNPQSGQCL